MPPEKFDPFTAPSAEEVPLPDAPLVRVLAQVRFPVILSIDKGDFIGGFQEAVRDRYPVLQSDQSRRFEVTPAGVKSGETSPIWRFSSAEGDWRISLAQGFMALETTAYNSRQDFVERFGEVLYALRREIRPALVERLGVRYIDRITGKNLDDIVQLVESGVLGIMATSAGESVLQATAEALFGHEDKRLVARWGLLPPHATTDPAVLEPMSERSWILDLDMFSSKRAEYDAGALQKQVSDYADRIYTFFRWIVNEEFLRRYGGRI